MGSAADRLSTRAHSIINDTTQHNMTRHDTTRHDTTRHDTTREARGATSYYILINVSSSLRSLLLHFSLFVAQIINELPPTVIYDEIMNNIIRRRRSEYNFHGTILNTRAV